MSSTDIADVVKFFKGYHISISGRAKALDWSRDADCMIGFRVAHAVAASVQAESPGRNVSLATVYWVTLLDVLCYRGLQRNRGT